MSMNRREFNRAAIGTAAVMLAPIGGAARFAKGQSMAQPADRPGRFFFEWRMLRKDVYAGIGAGGNTMVVLGDDGSLLIDTKLCGYGPVLRREVGMLGRPITDVVNTHHHGDHTGGNPSFTSDEGIMTLAHENAKPRIEAQVERYHQQIQAALRELARSDLPTVRATMEEVEALMESGAALDVRAFVPRVLMPGHESGGAVGTVEYELHHVGAGHTDNDIFVFVPELNVLHTGDLLFHKLHPFVDVGAGANSVGWQASLRRMLELCDEDTIVVPGHGEITDVEGIREQIEYFEYLRRIVRHAKDVDGMSRDEVMAMEPSRMAGYGFEHLRAPNLGVMYDEIESGG